MSVNLAADIPEPHRSPKLYQNSTRSGVPVRTIRRWGRLAKRFTAKMCLGKRVRLEFDRRRRRWGRYGRLLAYVILPGWLNLNAEIIRAGYGVAYRKYRHRLLWWFVDLEYRARARRRGLWAKEGFRGFAGRSVSHRSRRW